MDEFSDRAAKALADLEYEIADLVRKNNDLRELVRMMWDFWHASPDGPRTEDEELAFLSNVSACMEELGVEAQP